MLVYVVLYVFPKYNQNNWMKMISIFFDQNNTWSIQTLTIVSKYFNRKFQSKLMGGSLLSVSRWTGPKSTKRCHYCLLRRPSNSKVLRCKQHFKLFGRVNHGAKRLRDGVNKFRQRSFEIRPNKQVGVFQVTTWKNVIIWGVFIFFLPWKNVFAAWNWRPPHQK